MKKYNLSPGDFPDINDFQIKLAEQDFTKFHHSRQKMIDDVESVLSQDFPRLMEALPRLDPSAAALASASDYNGRPGPYMPSEPEWNNGADDQSAPNPFGSQDDAAWSLYEYVEKYSAAFRTASANGYVSGASAKTVLTSSGLAVASLRKIWDLSDIDKDGQLDLHEFVVAMYLSEVVKSGHPVPTQLDPDMIPPDKRR